jgi:hypothetical protein
MVRTETRRASRLGHFRAAADCPAERTFPRRVLRAGHTGLVCAERVADAFDVGSVPVEVPFRTEHLLGVVVNWPSVWPDR